jgi:ABC-type transporter Mla subunit MlaD
MAESQIDRTTEGVRAVLRRDRKAQLEEALTDIQATVSRGEQFLKEARQNIQTARVQEIIPQLEEFRLLQEETEALLKLYQ